MGFWGISPTGKAAQGRVGELGNWSYDQMPKWYQKADDYYNQGNYQNKQASDYWDNLLRNGAPSMDPNANRATGQQIMPGVDQTIQDRSNRLQTSLANFQALPGAADTGNQISGWIDQYGGAIGNNAEANREAIGSNWLRGLQGSEQAGRDITGNISGTYSGLGDMNNSAYGGMRKTSGDTFGKLSNAAADAYGGMKGQNDTAYSDIAKTLEMLKPGGSLQQAQVARSYAPEMVSTMGKLRSMGADNSPQAMDAIQGVQRDRARGMDEAAARSTGGYVSALNDARTGQLDRALGLGQNQLNTGLGLGQAQLSNELGLTKEQNANQMGLTREAGGLSRDEILRGLTNAQGLDASQLSQNLANNTDTMNRTTDYLGQRNQAAQLQRAMQQQDWSTVQDMLSKMNENDLVGLGLQNQQYQQGFNQNAYNQGLQGGAASQLGNLGQNNTNNMFRSTQQGQSFANDALKQYLASLGIEQQNAGWGSKLLGGLGMGALNMFLPGLFGGGNSGIGQIDRTIARG